MQVQRLKQFEAAINGITMAREGLENPADIWKYAPGLCSPLVNGALAGQFHARLQSFLMPKILMKQMETAQATPAIEDPASAIYFGICPATRQPIGLDRDKLTRPTLIVGTSGCGKTNEFLVLMTQFRQQKIITRVIDPKGELRKTRNICPDSIILDFTNNPINYLKPVGNKTAHHVGTMGEIAKAFSVMAVTWPLMVQALESIDLGIKSTQPYPSFDDFRRILEKKGYIADKENYFTAARAISYIVSILQETGFIRKGVDVSSKYSIIIQERVGLPPRVDSCITALDVQNIIMSVAEIGNSSGLKEALIIDEGSIIFGKEVNELTGAYIPPAKRLATQIRFTGIGLIVGTQSISSLDSSIIQNASTFVCFKCRHIDDARMAAKLLGLPREKEEELLKLPVGVAYMISEGWDRPYLFQAPLIECGPVPNNQQLNALQGSELEWIRSQIISSPKANYIWPMDYEDFLKPHKKPEPEAPKVEPKEEEKEPTPKKPDQPEFDLGTQSSQPKPDPGMLKDILDFLREVKAHPDIKGEDHTANLGWGAGKTHNMKEKLKQEGFIEEEKLKTGGRGSPKKVLTLTKKGEEFLNEKRS